jgi:hypothetical protein
MDEPDGFGGGTASDLPRAVIVAGISEKELHLLMSGCRKAQMQQALWATLTPTSTDWALKDLLSGAGRRAPSAGQEEPVMILNEC